MMSAKQPIMFLKHAEIDKAAWDHSLSTFANANVYLQSGFLDLLSPGWGALITRDYDTVMPLCWRKKWGIKYLYQPPFMQQLGIFSRKALTTSICETFIGETKKHFGFAEIFLNAQNPVPGTIEQANYLIDLSKGYSSVRSGYRGDAEKNVRRAEKFNLEYGAHHSIAELMTLYQQHYGDRTPHVKDADYAHFAAWCLIAGQQDQLVLRRVVDQEKTLLATALMLYFRRRLYLLQSVTTTAGRQKEANYFLIDRIIREFVGAAEIFDLEGSEIPGIAHFYKNFGSYNQPYYFLRYNNLPRLIRWLKE